MNEIIIRQQLDEESRTWIRDTMRTVFMDLLKEERRSKTQTVAEYMAKNKIKSKLTVYAHIKKGLLKSEKIGGRIKIYV